MKTEFEDLFKLIYSKTNYSQLILEPFSFSTAERNLIGFLFNFLVVGRYYFATNHHFSLFLFLSLNG